MTPAGLARLVQAAPRATAVTLAVLHAGDERLWCHGRRHRDGPPATPATGHEVGSVTKTFTALLLAEMAACGQVRLDDPLERHLPAARALRRAPAQAPITLLHLATHTSGLPRLPPGLAVRALPRWYTNPYAAYGDDRLLNALTRTRLRTPPGSRHRYSNLGIALLGRALAHAAATDYPALLVERVCRPLGLAHTGCGHDPAGDALGHRRGRPLPPWRIPGLPAAGALRSTGGDLLRYLRAHVDASGRPLAAALRDVQTPRLRLPGSGDHVCLAWSLRRVRDATLVFHAGATRGFTCFIGFSPETGTAVAALANTGPHPTSGFVRTAYAHLRQLALRPE
ncbi:serine hydrolase domain-containing protein [Streptomyces sp. SID10815]|uniref:serine hydrolase domain-containing protein n=1 Tax=Streptomyces sp. SID10815 TaxID=2706027 RepID=UPI0013C9283E|nr:serine hydrolase domain-containing protein [Streptomyces sp. SID10815]NEA45292.1 beta-lactamase family protein [Streptomyces sp. SID10815]